MPAAAYSERVVMGPELGAAMRLQLPDRAEVKALVVSGSGM